MGSALDRVPAIGRIVVTDRVISTGRVSSVSRGAGMLEHVGNGLVAYYRSDPQTISINSSNRVDSWADQSGNGKHATQTNPTRKPTLTNNWVGNLSGITFASGQVLGIASQIQTIAAPWTMGGVFQSTNNSSGRTIFAPTGSGGGAYLSIRASGSPNREVTSNQVAAMQDGAATTNVEVWMATAITTSNPSLLTHSLFTTINHTSQPLTPPTVSFFNPSGGQAFIGGISSTATQPFAGGTIGELFFMNRLMTSDEISRYLSYVQSRYGTI